MHSGRLVSPLRCTSLILVIWQNNQPLYRKLLCIEPGINVDILPTSAFPGTTAKEGLSNILQTDYVDQAASDESYDIFKEPYDTVFKYVGIDALADEGFTEVVLGSVTWDECATFMHEHNQENWWLFFGIDAMLASTDKIKKRTVGILHCALLHLMIYWLLRILYRACFS